MQFLEPLLASLLYQAFPCVHGGGGGSKKTIAELASDYGVHPNQITQWRKQALEDLPALFSSGQAKKDKAYEEERDELLKQIGQLRVEVEWLKKKSGILHSRRRGDSST